ncbi:MAG: response regulator [Acetobacteraceae bacterium]
MTAKLGVLAIWTLSPAFDLGETRSTRPITHGSRQVASKDSGADASASRPLVDLGLVSDINMPGMTGLELLPVVKQRRPDLAVFMISAYGDAATVARTLARGTDKFLAKPVDFPRAQAGHQGGDLGIQRHNTNRGAVPSSRSGSAGCRSAMGRGCVKTPLRNDSAQ